MSSIFYPFLTSFSTAVTRVVFLSWSLNFLREYLSFFNFRFLPTRDNTIMLFHYIFIESHFLGFYVIYIYFFFFNDILYIFWLDILSQYVFLKIFVYINIKIYWINQVHYLLAFKDYYYWSSEGYYEIYSLFLRIYLSYLNFKCF